MSGEIVSTMEGRGGVEAAREGSSGCEPLYFFGPRARETGYLSQWYPSRFEVLGDTYWTCEMWMMVQKARLFGDEDTAKQMLETSCPRTHKVLGRKVKGFD